MIDQHDIRIDDLPPEYREIAEGIGLAAALALVTLRGGEGVYIPKAEKIARKARDRSIRAEFTGSNHRELARRFNLSVVQIRNILAEGANTPARSGVDVIDKQISLF